MASNSQTYYLMGYPHEQRLVAGDVFRFFGHKFDNIQYIAEELDPLTMCKRFIWLTHDKKSHEYRFQEEGNSMNDLQALLVALRMS